MSTERPLYLLTNDDGIESPFLKVWAQVLSEHARVVVVAPATGQSGVGRALTVRRRIEAKEHEGLPCLAWSVDGTPTDCVNIALGHLMQERPAAVLAGINEGFNVGIPLIWSSGTVAAALEGAFWHIPAWAASFELEWEVHRALLKGEDRHGALAPMLPAVRLAAEHMVRLIQAEDASSSGPQACVHNVNFPSKTTAATPIMSTVPFRQEGLSFFQKATEPNVFKFSRLCLGPAPEGSDIRALQAGCISHSRLPLC